MYSTKCSDARIASRIVLQRNLFGFRQGFGEFPLPCHAQQKPLELIARRIFCEQRLNISGNVLVRKTLDRAVIARRTPHDARVQRLAQVSQDFLPDHER